MKIVFDLDNTLANYVSVFKKLAKDYELDELSATSKALFKKAIVEKYGEDQWTLLQGRLYSHEMIHAEPFIGFFDSMNSLEGELSELSIVSHRSKLSHSIEKHDLHSPAIKWIEKELLFFKKNSSNSIFFTETLEQKIAQINRLKPNILVDDLLPVINHDCLNKDIKRILFCPDDDVTKEFSEEFLIMRSWTQFPDIIRRMRL